MILWEINSGILDLNQCQIIESEQEVWDILKSYIILSKFDKENIIIENCEEYIYIKYFDKIMIIECNHINIIERLKEEYVNGQK
jgi:hypothetical protein